MRLADARALHAGLVTARADPAADRQGLERLALWCNRFTPWCAVDGEDGLLLDITGCAHLFGGEAALMDEIAARVTGLGVESRLGLADTPGAAWALARFGPAETRIAAPGGAQHGDRGPPGRGSQARGRGCPPAAPPGPRHHRRGGGPAARVARPSLPLPGAGERGARAPRPGAGPAGRADRAHGPAARLPGAPGPAGAPDRPGGARRGAGPAHARTGRVPGAGRARRAAACALVLPGRRRRGPARGRHGARDAGRRSPASASSGRRWRPSTPASASISRRSTPSVSSRWRPRSFRSPGISGGRATWTCWSIACWPSWAKAPSAAWSRSPATGRSRRSRR